jgi:glycosyltransferase involved in cell wall biosynthesis
LRELLAHCRALIVPGEEDFGLVSVEALASGKPVIALGHGGALESVPVTDPLGGVFYDEPDETQLAEAVHRFEQIETQIRPRELQAWASQFSEACFHARMREILEAPAERGSNAAGARDGRGLDTRPAHRPARPSVFRSGR